MFRAAIQGDWIWKIKMIGEMSGKLEKSNIVCAYCYITFR